MSSIRRMRPCDLFSLNLTNLDPLTENYDLHFYLVYMIRWPSLFNVVEDRDGKIVGYSILPHAYLFLPLQDLICSIPSKKLTFTHSHGKNRSPAGRDAQLTPLHALAWPCHSPVRCASVAAAGSRNTTN